MGGLVGWAVCGTMLAMQPDWGVSRQLADHRSKLLRNVAYDLTLKIPERLETPVLGTVCIRFNLAAAETALPLDFDVPDPRISKMSINGLRVEPTWMKGHLLLARNALNIGENIVDIEFEAGDAALNRTADFMYSLFVPDRASTCFPCFDQPDIKAVFTLDLDAPSPWEVVCYAESRPVSTYLFAFAAGEFQKKEIEGLSIYHRETDVEKFTRCAGVIARQHRESQQWLENYTGIAMPFAPFSVVLIPGFQYGGMEHVGHIFYRAESLLLDPSATLEQELARASVIAHETAHMWFGNLVTMEWFNDVWLKEVFANLMAAKMVNPQYPDIDHELRFLLRHYPSAFAIDRTAGAHPVIQELVNLKQAGSLYGDIIYRKAPIGMRMLEEQMGAKAFRRALQEYLRVYAYRNATWSDLLTILQRHSDSDLLKGAARLFVDTGIPRLSAEADVFDYGVGPNHFRMDPPATSVQRARRLMTHWESVQDGAVTAESFIALLLEFLPHENDPQVVGLVLNYLEEAFWRFCRPEHRLRIAPRMERVLHALVYEAEDTRIRKGAFRTMINTALSEAKIESLRRLWLERREPKGVPLSENDYAVIAFELAVRGVNVMDTQVDRLSNPDHRARFQFIMSSAHTDPLKRASFFQRLMDPAERTREPWVLDGLRYLNHPLRSETSIVHLEHSLYLLEEIQRTGNIFFPRSWLDAAFAGHQSPEAVEIIERYLYGNEDLDPSLRRKVLQAADPVFRAARVLYP